MNEINLWNLELKVFTEQDVLDYCQLNNINPSNITELDLSYNKLTDISGIKLFKNLKVLILNNNEIKDISLLKDLINLEKLYIDYNKIKDISVVQYLNNLYELDINNLKLKLNQSEYINKCKNLRFLYCHNGFKKSDSDVLKLLNHNIEIYGL